MKHLFNITLSLLIFSTCCCSQPIMRYITDASKIKSNEKKYLNRSLGYLLYDIKPAITYVLANPSNDNQVRLGSLTFRFQDTATMQRIRNNGQRPVSITIFVKEPFNWNFINRPPDEKFTWTAGDAERLQNLTVLGIRVVEE